MRSFTPDYIENRLAISPNVLRLIAQIRECKGRQDLYIAKKPEVLENLKQVAFIESIESSNRLERIQTTRDSLQKLVHREEEPHNRPQTELAGYRDVLEQIHQSHAGMSFSTSLARQFHRDLLKYTMTPGGDYKKSPNDIAEKNAKGEITRVRFVTVAPFLTPQAMDDLHTGFKNALLRDYDPLLLIPNYVHDFLCIHPFSDGNGRMARLLTVLLLYKHGFNVACYISIEKLIENSKHSYYESLNYSDKGWHAGVHNHLFFTEYLLTVILEAYKTLEADIEEIQIGRGYKTALVTSAIDKAPETFSISTIENLCPTVGRDTVRNVLRKYAKEGKIENVSKGRNAQWKKIG